LKNRTGGLPGVCWLEDPGHWAPLFG
jgi:hypothetical protein